MKLNRPVLFLGLKNLERTETSELGEVLINAKLLLSVFCLIFYAGECMRKTWTFHNCLRSKIVTLNSERS
jgi:hypothetical protein